MENSYGVDVEYFRRELEKLLTTLDNRTPVELHRYFTALANVAIPIHLWKDVAPPPDTVTITFTDCEVSDLFELLCGVGSRTRLSCRSFSSLLDKACEQSLIYKALKSAAIPR